jgi:hypothetical protein
MENQDGIVLYNKLFWYKKCQEAYCFNDVERGQLVLEIFVLVR